LGKKKLLCAFASLFLIIGCGGGGGGLKGLLPSTAEVQGIKKEGRALLYEGKKLFDYMDGGAELFYEYGFERACVQRYKVAEGEVTVEIYQMDLPTDAYGIYTFDTQGEHPQVGQEATYEKGLLTFWKGRYFVRAFAQNEGLKESILALGRVISQKITEKGNRPEILEFLPPVQMRIRDTLLYLRGMIALNNAYFLSHQNVLSLGEGVEGITFKYLQENQPLRVVMVRYPGSPQAEKAFQSFCASGVIKEGILKDEGFLGKSRRGYGGVKLVEDLLILVLDGKDLRTVKRALRTLPYKHKGDK